MNINNEAIITAAPGEKSPKSTELGVSSKIDCEKDFSDPPPPGTPGSVISPGTAAIIIEKYQKIYKYTSPIN